MTSQGFTEFYFAIQIIVRKWQKLVLLVHQFSREIRILF